jgi:predicted DNA-binding transcriptional regulator AlpA
MDTHNSQQPRVELKAFSVDEFCAAHGISRAFFYLLQKERRGPRTLKVGRRTLVSVEAAAEWRNCLAGEG